MILNVGEKLKLTILLSKMRVAMQAHFFSISQPPSTFLHPHLRHLRSLLKSNKEIQRVRARFSLSQVLLE